MYGLETVVSVLFIRILHARANRTMNEKFNNERGEAELSIEKFRVHCTVSKCVYS